MQDGNLLNKIFSNIRYYAHAKHIKIGEMEMSCGMPVGKLSRLPNLKAMELIKIAQYIGVGIDELVYEDTEVIELNKRIKELEKELAELKKEKEKTNE